MAANKPSSTPAPKKTVDPYHELDPIPQPEVNERSSETVWALWSEVKDKEHARYADTVPLTVPGATAATTRTGAQAPGAPRRPAAPQGSSGADKLMEESKRNNRVCPKPEHWQRLDAMLRAKAPAAAASLPKPVPAGDMKMMPSLARRSMFRGVTDWAVANGLTEDTLQFVRALPEAEWHHLGE